MFLTEFDYAALTDKKTLDLLQQSDPVTRGVAEQYAIEEVSGYLRGRYDTRAIFEAQATERNPHLVMICIDVVIYHLIAWLPSKMGYELRKERYDRAISWLRQVQQGLTSPDLPAAIQPENTQGGSILFGSIIKNENTW